MSESRRSRAIDFHNKAIEVVKTDPQMAYRLLSSCVTVDPTMAAGWFMIGNSLADLKLRPAAIAAFERCVRCDLGEQPGDLTPELRARAEVNLGHWLMHEGRLNDAAFHTQRAIDVYNRNPDFPARDRAFAYTNMSLIGSVNGQDRDALQLAKTAFSISREPMIETGLAFAYLFSGDYANGLKHFEARIPYKMPQMLSYPWPRWDGKACRRLFVASDQGIGDSVSFARFVSELSCRGLVQEIVFQVQPEILSLMTAAFEDYRNMSVIPVSSELPDADAWCPVGSLPVAMGMTTEQIRDCEQGWNASDRMRIGAVSMSDDWRSKDAKLHIGIAYGGSPSNDIDRWRSIPVTEFLKLYEVPGVQLYSLQVGERVADLHSAGAVSLIRDMSPWIRDAEDTVAIMRQLDLVITVESFVGHLAGAIGKECWIPLSLHGGDWRCGRHGDHPLWYPNTTLFRKRHGEWSDVFERMVERLKRRLARGDA